MYKCKYISSLEQCELGIQTEIFGRVRVLKYPPSTLSIEYQRSTQPIFNN